MLMQVKCVILSLGNSKPFQRLSLHFESRSKSKEVCSHLETQPMRDMNMSPLETSTMSNVRN